jgi:hypothetical protein
MTFFDIFMTSFQNFKVILPSKLMSIRKENMMKIVFSIFITIILICCINCGEPDYIKSHIEGNVFDSDTGELIDSADVFVFEITSGTLMYPGSMTHKLKETTSDIQGYFSLIYTLHKDRTYYLGSAKSGYFTISHNSSKKRIVQFNGNQRIDLFMEKIIH